MPDKKWTAQPQRFSNSFAREELELVSIALRKEADFRSLDQEDYDALSQVMHAALVGRDIRGIVKSGRVRQALTKLERCRNLADELARVDPGAAVRSEVTEKVEKMLARAKANAQEKSRDTETSIA